MRSSGVILLILTLCNVLLEPGASQSAHGDFAAHIESSPGFALRFYGNGTNDIDRVKIPIDAPALPVDVGFDFTLEFWMQAHTNSSGPITPGGDNWINGNIIFDRDIYFAGDYGDFGISLAAYRIAFGVDRLGSGNTIYGTTQLNDNEWHHIALTRDASGGQLRIFVDGVLDASGAGPAGDVSYRDGRSSVFPADPYLVIGAEKHDAGAAYPSYNGMIDEVRISNIVRYSTNFTRPTAPFVADASTVALYHFDEAGGIAVLDTSGAIGGPSDGQLRIGGTPLGPEWVLSDAPLFGSSPSFNITLNKSTYVNGDSLTALEFRPRNPSASPIPVHLKIWLIVPAVGEVVLVEIGANESFSLPSNLDFNLGPVTLLTVSASFPPKGIWQFNSRLRNPATTVLIHEDINPFVIQ
jgi:hypothetical protein